MKRPFYDYDDEFADISHTDYTDIPSPPSKKAPPSNEFNEESPLYQKIKNRQEEADRLSPPMESEPMPLPPRPPRSLEKFNPPDYSDREGFENHIFKEIGGNPFDIDPMQEVKKSMSQLPLLFSHVFSGKILWDDRGHMSTKQAAFWNDVVNLFRANQLNESNAKKQQLVDKYNRFMTMWDNDKKSYEAKLKEYDKQLHDWYIAQQPTEPTTDFQVSYKKWLETNPAGTIEEFIKVWKGAGAGGKPSDFMVGYNAAVAKIEKVNEELPEESKIEIPTMEEYRTKYWLKEPGGLTEDNVLEELRASADWNDEDTNVLYEEYRKLRTVGKGMGREEAYEKVTKESKDIIKKSRTITREKFLEFLRQETNKNGGFTKKEIDKAAEKLKEQGYIIPE